MTDAKPVDVGALTFIDTLLPGLLRGVAHTLKMNAPGTFTGAEQVCEQSADALLALQAVVADYERVLSDPLGVHNGMLRGLIAKISMEQCAHSHGEDAVKEYNALKDAQAEVARLTQENARLAGEVADLGDALVYVAHTLHTTPQHMLCKGVSLIDSNRVRVRIGNIDVTATEREEGKEARRDE